MILNELTEQIIGLAIKVHRKLGPGFLESVYQSALAYEFKKAGIAFEKEKVLPVPYEEIILEVGFRCDFLVDSKVIVECRAVQELTQFDQAKLLNYLKITQLQVGLLINFNVLLLKDGIKRLVNHFSVEDE
jgi:GxxExxY protein